MPKPIKLCSIPNCGKRCQGAGYCNLHYRRWKKFGDPAFTRRPQRGPDACTVTECAHAGPFKKGYCSLHYQRWLRHGDPLAKPERVYPQGTAHWMWVGDRAAYRTVHARLDRTRGKASEHACECGARASQWAYDHSDPEERIGIVTGGIKVPYSLNPDCYKAVCQPCHRRLDNK